MALEAFPLKLEAEVIRRIKADAEKRGVTGTRYARDLIHTALTQDSGQELDQLKRKVLTLETKLDHLTETVIDGLAALLRSLAVDEQGRRVSHTVDQANAFIKRLRTPES